MIDNIYTPFPFSLHLAFCVFATLFLILQFYRKKYIHYILLIIGIDLTFATQYTKNDKIIFTLGLIELVLVISIFVMMFITSRKAKKAQKRSDDSNHEHNKEIDEAEDIFKNAFSDDD